MSLSLVSLMGVREGIKAMWEICMQAHPILKTAAKLQYQMIAVVVRPAPVRFLHGKHSSNTKKKHKGTMMVPARYQGFLLPMLVSNLSEYRPTIGVKIPSASWPTRSTELSRHYPARLLDSFCTATRK